jgi:flagellar protein FliO/FliZ
MDTVVLVGRLLVSLAVVLGVLWLVGKRMNRRGRRTRNALIEVLGRQQLGRHSAVAVVRVAEQTLVLGITEGAVSLLTTAEAGEAELADAAAQPARTARRPDRTLAKGTTATPRSHRASRPADDEAAPERSALSGSALSPATWRQAVDSLRDLTARTG